MRDLAKEFKFSNYNHKIELDGNLYAYNALSGGFCKFDGDIRDILSNIEFNERTDIQELNILPEEIIDGLKKGGFIVHKDLDEFALIKSKHLMSRYSDNNSLGLTIIPTKGCNFRCTYCFEGDKEYPNEGMSEDVMDATIKLIEDRLGENGNLSITWFGGEPLIRFDIIKKLQNRILEIVDKKKLKFSSGIITNGYLLSKKVSDELVALKIDFAQVTIDGPKDIHNSKRIMVNGKGSFDVIINNILDANKNLRISIRTNIEKDNISTMSEFMDYLIKIGVGESENINPYFAVVEDYSSESEAISSSCFTIKEFAKEEIFLNKMAYLKGINVHNRINPNISVCGSLSPKTLVIEPDGTLQKCWGLVGESTRSIGNIIQDLNTNVNQYTKNQSEWYSWSKFDNSKCKVCNILPLCMGGCPLHTMGEDPNDNKHQCITYKYNIDDVLKQIAFKNINNKKLVTNI